MTSTAQQEASYRTFSVSFDSRACTKRCFRLESLCIFKVCMAEAEEGLDGDATAAAVEGMEAEPSMLRVPSLLNEPKFSN